MCSETRKVAEKLSTLETDDSFRNECTAQLLEKLYSMGIINTKRLKHCKEVSVSSFCRRRLPVFMKKSGMFNGPLEVAGKSNMTTTQHCSILIRSQHSHSEIRQTRPRPRRSSCGLRSGLPRHPRPGGLYRLDGQVPREH